MPHTQKTIHSNSRRLLVAVFTTLFVVAISFVGTFYYFNLLNQRVFKAFEGFAVSANTNADISREIVGIELKIREMISIVLSSPEQLPQIRNDLLTDFAELKDDVSDKDQLGNKQIDATLDNYKIALDALMQDYMAMNDTLLSLNTFYEDYAKNLKQLEAMVGQLIVDVAMSGIDSMGLQQNYMLLPLCVEELLYGQMLIRSSITTNDPALLGVPRAEKDAPGAKPTTLSHLEAMGKTLSTMTSAQEPIGSEAKKLLNKIPIYRGQIQELHRILLAMRDDSENFKVARTDVLHSLEYIEDQTDRGIINIRTLINRHGNQELIISFIISGSILAVSLLGLLVAWSTGKHLENAAKDAIEAKGQQLIVNQQLEEEIHERQQMEEALRQSRDELELRVNERTTELSTANAQLQAEIMERLKTEKKLAGERERLSITLRSIGDGVISTDTDGRVTLLNQNAEKLTGWDQQEAIGRPLHEIFRILHEETREPCENPVEKALTSGCLVELDNHTVLIAKDGAERNIADSGALIHDKDNTIIGVVLVFRDITEQLRQEKELFSTQKMESIGTLAGGIAHDFNNILSAIIGYNELAMKQAKENALLLDNLREIRKASERATGLVRQILTYSRKQQQQKTPLQLSLIVKEAMKLLRASIPATVEIRQEIISEATVMADPTQIHQVVMNLCTNAYHAMMDQSGELSVTLKEITNEQGVIDNSTSLPPGQYLKLSISDTGCGMDKAIMDKIFEPYFTTKEQGKGTGLGLAVVHGIIKSHDGRITVTSEPGRGTTFNVYLPIIVHEAVTEVAEVEPPLARANERLMLVDDEGMIRDLTSQFLSQAGYRVGTFANGREAWLALSQAPADWDLLITDQTMPEMTGNELSAKALEVRPDLPIIVCSGHYAMLHGDQGQNSGVFAYLQKPVDFNALLHQIAKALEQKG